MAMVISTGNCKVAVIIKPAKVETAYQNIIQQASLLYFEKCLPRQVTKALPLGSIK